jgi:hypothetical protein
MAIDKVDNYTAKVSSGAEAVDKREVTTKRKARLSTKVFILTMLGTMTIVIFDGLKSVANDPAWAVMCILIGIPIYLIGLFEFFRTK